jgi:hypothetical protein
VVSDVLNESDDFVLYILMRGPHLGCEIPYRALLPRGIEGLLMACRAFSVSRDAHYALRMQGHLRDIGNAAGLAAAIAVRDKLAPRSVDVSRVQDVLSQTGVLKSKYPGFHDPQWRLDPAKVMKLPGGMTPALLSSMPGIPGSVEGLIRAVETNDRSRPKGGYGQINLHAIKLLGMLEAAEAVPALLGHLNSRHASYGSAMHAVISLGRIGDRQAVQGIADFLESARISTLRTLGQPPIKHPHYREYLSTGVTQDVTWQKELICADALARLGTVRNDLVEKHLEDERAYVRRYAKMVRKRLLRPEGSAAPHNGHICRRGVGPARLSWRAG